MIRYFAPALVLFAGVASFSEAEELQRAGRPLAEAFLLDVGIHVFDPSPEDFEALREAEARYIPTHLARTLQATGFWGVVRMVPAARNVDVNVSGAVLRSNGAELRLRVRVEDARGKVWLDKKYKKKAEENVPFKKDPIDDRFQALFNEIANDLYGKRRKLDVDDSRDLRNMSRLRFATDLAPSIFGDYLDVEKTRYSIARLPAREDPMMARVDLILARDGMFLDTLDAHYRDFYDKMTGSYEAWRSEDYWERETIRNAGVRAAPMGIRGAAPGSWIGGPVCALPSDFQRLPDDSDRRTKKDREPHIAALQELGESLAADVEPLLIEVEGEVLRLTGSLETQYADWRKLLRDIFAAETGLPIVTRR